MFITFGEGRVVITFITKIIAYNFSVWIEHSSIFVSVAAILKIHYVLKLSVYLVSRTWRAQLTIYAHARIWRSGTSTNGSRSWIRESYLQSSLELRKWPPVFRDKLLWRALQRVLSRQCFYDAFDTFLTHYVSWDVSSRLWSLPRNYLFDFNVF